MFNPDTVKSNKGAKAAKKKALADLKAECERLIPSDIHEGTVLTVLYRSDFMR
jgi:hypothetical protein